ncbi:hypothetical protein NEPTK9_001812 [Candidatus Neptunochlamydia vexilliferae]|uniref:Uncharacterized protein n=1 Tax=Candidatus Neptunichlamydia vexilliferae TaxID=1651774 RepID=A0ABS0B1K2_9BACT|nr:hypothetical protein [Candidatus Neptunochlamydia vexilliferae]
MTVLSTKNLGIYSLLLGSVEKFIARSSGIFPETCDFFASKIAPDYLHSAKNHKFQENLL